MVKTAVIVGGGITGLTAMYYLQKWNRNHSEELKLILLEANEYLGGKIHTVHDGQFIMEAGADSIVTRHESVMPLVQDLNLQDQAVYNATGKSYIHRSDKLHAIPEDTIFGIPMSLQSLFSSTLLSTRGKIAALRDLISKNSSFTSESSVGQFLESFLGKELVANQIAPVLSGVYSGKLDKLTLASTMPYLIEYKNKYGSIIRGLAKNRERFQSGGNKKFLSFKSGLSTMIHRLEEVLSEASILKGVRVSGIDRDQDRNRYRIAMENHPVIEADYIVLSTPHHISQAILNQVDLNSEFDKLKNSSLTSIYFGFDVPDDQLPADGTGFIVSENSDLLCDACTWTSRKWPHTSSRNNLLVRLFFKSSNPSYTSMQKLSKSGQIQAALSDVEKSLGITVNPQSVEVTGWNNLMPNYSLEHSGAVQSLEQKMAALYPNVLLAGASYYGVGIGACIKNGKEVAEQISASLDQN